MSRATSFFPVAWILAGGLLLAPDPEKEAGSADLARELVSAAHGDLERVRRIAHEHPELIHAAVDLGGGRWETALGAAAHSGRTDIAAYLLGKGARMDLFAAAAMGYTEVVKAITEAYPVPRKLAPLHDCSLVEVARAGGEASREIVRFLESRPEHARPASEPLTPELRQRYAGRYRTRRGFEFEILARGEALVFHPEGLDEPLEMIHCGHHEFRAAKDPLVRMIFDASGELSRLVAIDEGSLEDSDSAARID